MAADFLFVLCKENTERLIRYTGYGNSAGFLATRGLMVPGVKIDGDYSEDELTDVEVDDNVDVTTGSFKLYPISVSPLELQKNQNWPVRNLCTLYFINLPGHLCLYK